MTPGDGMAKRSNRATAPPRNAASTTAAKRSLFPGQLSPNAGPVTLTYQPDPFADMGQHDRRQYNPTRAYTGPASIRKNDSRIKVGKRLSSLQFQVSKNVALCIRRKRRTTAVMVWSRRAKRLLSKAGSSKKHRNAYSRVGC